MYPRPPLRLANPRVQQKQVGTSKKNDEPKCAVPIPPNPIERQPNGTKPPTTNIGIQRFQANDNEKKSSNFHVFDKADSMLSIENRSKQILIEEEKSSPPKYTGNPLIEIEISSLTIILEIFHINTLWRFNNYNHPFFRSSLG